MSPCPLCVLAASPPRYICKLDLMFEIGRVEINLISPCSGQMLQLCMFVYMLFICACSQHQAKRQSSRAQSFFVRLQDKTCFAGLYVCALHACVYVCACDAWLWSCNFGKINVMNCSNYHGMECACDLKLLLCGYVDSSNTVISLS